MVRNSIWQVATGASLIVVLVLGCNSQPSTVATSSAHSSTLTEFKGTIPAMGVQFNYTVYATPSQWELAQSIVKQSLNELESTFSDYQSDSEAMQLSSSSPHSEPISVSRHMAQLCQVANDVSERTDGAFDVTVGPISHLWRAAIKRNRLPEQEKISTVLPAVGYTQLKVLPGQKIQLRHPNMELDFGGIAKGYAADVILERFLEVGIQHALVDASGDVSVLGTPPNRNHWEVVLPKLERIAPIILKLGNASVATSGNSNQALVVDGKRYSHIVDPRTGQSITHTSRVTVIAPTGAEADALASAFSVMQPREALQLADEWPDVEVFLVYNDEKSGNLTSTQSSGFSEFISGIPVRYLGKRR